jgi:cellulose synthase/poly-beta-1,6-N-acetylglucosamine synthase-like glycosyltransferase
MSTVALLIIVLLAIPAIFASGYLMLLTLLSARAALPARSSRRIRFDVVIPAHNEVVGIGRTIDSLRRVDWPNDRFRILVVADNCTDDTAAVARRAGATVIERTDADLRGKGYALAYAFEWSRTDGFADALVVIDADAEVSGNLLEAIATRLDQGLNAIQVHYGVLNPNASWRTRLLSVAKGSFHIVRSRARERLGLTCGIRGNGWCVTHALLRRVPYTAFSRTEDLEYGISLGLAGERVAYADEAHSDADMASGERIARAQRARWEQGRFALIRAKTWPLMKAAVTRRSAVCLDLALDLMVLPLSYVALNVSALLLVAGGASLYWPVFREWVWIGAACAFALIAYVLRGWQLSGTGLRGLLDLLRAPWFLAWKLLVAVGSPNKPDWVRTERENE